MKRAGRKHQAPDKSLLAVGLVLCLGTQAVLATKEVSRYRLIVRVHNYARVKPLVLSQAKRAAGQVFSASGIELSWFDVPLAHA